MDPTAIAQFHLLSFYALLSQLQVKIGVAYKLNGTRLLPGQMPSTLIDLERVEVEYETMPGWKQSIEDCQSFDDLPSNAQAYVKRIEELCNVPVSWIGTGPKREQMVENF